MNIFTDLFLLQRIDHLVRTRATGTPQNLADRLNISERNLYRLLGNLRNQGFPIAYDKHADTYYYSEPVKIEFSILVGKENLMTIRGGEKKLDPFFRLPNFGSGETDFCRVSD
ncbi:MAG: hypothetical protein JNN28_14060 [Saprospiraceae bacterium]|nr:hypothetical protein [Saprospiraceae bacterium]